jgi:hypothetical protein
MTKSRMERGKQGYLAVIEIHELEPVHSPA